MIDKKLNRAWTVTGLILLIAVAIVFIVRQASAPGETIRDPAKFVPKEMRR